MKRTSLAVFALLVSAFAAAQLSVPELQPVKCTETQAAPTAGRTTGWPTPSEASGYCRTPRYDETLAYVRRIAKAAPKRVKLETFGKTGEGRDLVAVIVSKDGEFDPATLHRQSRPIVLVQNAIHAGETDGKDASLALLRDIVITRGKASLIDRVVLVVIPIYNADGHERFSAFNRINQNGPAEMGWRTQAENLNLNRDYMKAEAPETRAFLKLWNEWLPDFFVDNHVTDGADYQFDATYLIDSGPDVNPALAQWIDSTLKPYLKKSVDASGHLLAPYIWLQDETDPTKGFTTSQDPPRYSTGYSVLQNRPGLLVEMHMLKDYKTRVTGNYEVMRALLEVVNRDANTLVAMNRAADDLTRSMGKNCPDRKQGTACEFPLKLEPTGKTEPFLYKGYKFTRVQSEVSGDTWVQYSHEPFEQIIPRQNELKITKSVTVPRAYIVPAQWTRVIEVLKAHGLKLLRTSKPYDAEVQAYRCERPRWSEQSFEGHHLAGWKSQQPCKLGAERMQFPAGSVVVPLDQRAARVAIQLLEPEGSDSFVAWGFFDTMFEQKEYGEGYVLEKLAREMMAKEPQLKAEFENKLATDKAFAANPRARLNWFYQHSPWWDTQFGLYPVARLVSLEGVPTL